MSAPWADAVNFKGKHVLDVGGYSGEWAAEALRRGAKSATVVDNREWERYGWDEPILADARIVQREGDLMTWTKPADIVLCSNVLYHLPDPVGGLERLRAITREPLVLRTSFEGEDEVGDDGWRWYPDGMGHENGTVWARPSLSGLERALTQAGFAASERSGIDGANDQIVYVCHVSR